MLFCFVSETGQVENPYKDPSVRYRCYHPAEALTRLGHRCAIYSAKNFYQNPNLNYDVYLFHRPNVSRSGFTEVLGFLRRNGKVCIADYDDLIFGSEHLAMQSSAVKNNTLSPDQAVRAFSANLQAMQQFDKVSGSTQPLVDQVRCMNPDAMASVVRNFLPPSMVSVHDEMGTRQRSRGRVNIGYFAGTKSHDRDFPVVEAALHRVLCENPHAHLLVVGPVRLPASIAAMPNVSIAPVVDYLRLPTVMSRCSVAIAPLEMSEFNRCKSRVKFLEAALSGVWLIASPIPDMQAIGAEHLSLASSMDCWYEALSAALNNEDRTKFADRNFQRIAQGANEYIEDLRELGVSV